MTKKLCFALSALLFLANPISAMAQTSYVDTSCKNEPHRTVGFEDRPWYKPMVANPRDPKIQLLGFAISDPYEFMVNRGRHTILDATFGKEMPLFVWEPKNGNMGKGCWGFGVWFPMSVFVIEDFTDPSDPLVNMDFVLGPSFKFFYGLTHRDVLSFKLQYAHQSSHTGDDFMITGMANYPNSFMHFGISYEYLDMGINWDRKFKFGTLSNRFSVEVIASRPYYAAIKRAQAGNGTSSPITRNYEPAYGFEYMPSGNHGWRPYLSSNSRLKTIYNYNNQVSKKDTFQFSQAVIIGIKNLAHPDWPEFVILLYYGLNPNGQFRKQNDYKEIGFGVRFDPFKLSER